MNYNKNRRPAQSINEPNGLIAITEKKGQKSVDARELYQFLMVGRDFSAWINHRINEYGFLENSDFEVFSKIGGNPKGGRPSKEYSISLDMAKELAMVERNQRGRQARRYFIEVEKLMQKQVSTFKIPKDIKFTSINDRKVTPYRTFLLKIGASTGGSAYRRKANYPNHFIKIKKVLYVTEQMALHVLLTTKSFKNRTRLKEMQPILPPNFGNSQGLLSSVNIREEVQR